MTAYAELAVTTNFSFLRGASHPGEMVARADELGLAAIGIADRNSFAGVVRAYDEAKDRTIKLLVGTRLVTVDGFEVLTYPIDRQAYGRLCQLLTQGNLKADKGECHLTFEQILNTSEGQIFIAIPPQKFPGRSAAPKARSRASSTRYGEAEWCAADPGSSRTPSLERSRISGAPLRAAPHPGNEAEFTERLSALVHAAPGRAFLAGVHYHRGDEPRRLGLLGEDRPRHRAPPGAGPDVQ
jgi:error-prone DNA polymerase